MTEKSNIPAVQEPTIADRFLNSVLQNFNKGNGKIEVTGFQRKLIQNYFMKLDMVLRDAEQKRMAKDERYRDLLAFTWDNVNMPKLAQEVVAFTAIGLDPLQPNHINLIPFKNNSTKKYDINFMMGYRGMELKAKKYGVGVPDDVIIELIFSNDHFKQYKKDRSNNIEAYDFEVTAFDRGEIIGGFYYYVFNDNPTKNKLKVFSLSDILKRRPEHASAQFWGGEKDVWAKDDKGKNIKSGTEKVEGWFEEMCYKTIARAAYNNITIDSEKIDEHLMTIIEREQMMEALPETKQEQVKAEIAANAGAQTITIPVAESAPEGKKKEQATADNNGQTSAPF